jgi:hypothetical protein
MAWAFCVGAKLGKVGDSQSPFFKSLISCRSSSTLFCRFCNMFFMFLIFDSEGEPQIAPERIGKLEERKKRLQEAEQYALWADFNAFYPCFSCPNDSMIYLQKGEIWKYGITIQGRGKRYSFKKLKKLGLTYQVQFRGNIHECLAVEAEKIYFYPKLPEN